MKRKIITYTIIAFVSAVIGFLIGIVVENKILLNSTEGLEGTYKTNTWNGKEAVLVLNKDHTCIYPTGDKGIWSIEGNTLYLEIESSYFYADGEIHTIESKDKHEATIVDKGIMINTHFFEKVR